MKHQLVFNQCTEIVQFVEKRLNLCRKANDKYNSTQRNKVQDRIIKNIPSVMYGFPIWNKENEDITGNYQQIFTAVKIGKAFGLQAFCNTMRLK